MRHRLIILVVILVVAAGLAVAAAAAGYRYGTRERDTDAQVLAQPVLAPVERRTVASSVTVAAVVESGTAATVALPGASLDRRVVTGAFPAAGDLVHPGGVLAEIDDRPVIVIPGTTPLYRELTTGDRGPDVARLQASLAALGYALEVDGRFGGRTAEAVRRLYADRGHEAPTGSGGDGGAEGEGDPGGRSRADAPVARPDELLVTGDDPLLVVESSRGDPGAGLEPLVRVAGPELVARSSPLDPAAGDALATAAAVVVTRPGEPDSAVRVTGLERVSADDGVHLLARFPFEPGGPWIGESVALEAELYRSPGPVLVVPAVAVVPAGDSGTAVRVWRQGVITVVPVQVGPTVDGVVVIEEADDLAEGDQVVVG